MWRFLILNLGIFLTTNAAVVPDVADLLVPQVDTRIIGGYDAAIEDHPYQLSLQINNRHYCGGVLISNQFGLTARHCTIRYAVDAYTIVAGVTISNTTGTSTAVTEFIDHPNYNSVTYDYDISVIRFTTPITPNGISIAIINMMDTFPAVGATAVVSGWGYMEVNSTVSTQLQAVKVPIVSMTTCRTAYGQQRITDRMLCAGFTAGQKDACNGDSGGPIAVKGELVGIVSWGRSCAVEHYPGVYASISNLRQWVRDNSGV